MPLPAAPQQSGSQDVFDKVAGASAAPAAPAAKSGDVFDQAATAAPQPQGAAVPTADAPFTEDERRRATSALRWTENKAVASGRVPPSESDIADYIHAERRGEIPQTRGAAVAKTAARTGSAMIPMVGGIVGGPEGFAAGTAADSIIQDLISGKKADVNKAATDTAVALAAGKITEGALNLIGRAALRMPPVQKAVEGIFRALPSDHPDYRGHVVASLWDLQQMAKNGTIPERAAGGIVNPEMYFRQMSSAIDTRLQQMYNTEYFPQIQVAAREGLGVQLTEHPDVLRQALRHVARSEDADSPVRTLALRLMENPNQRIPIEDAAALDKSVNAHLRTLQAASGEQRYVKMMKSATLSSLDRLDTDLGNLINSRLQDIDQPGIRSYGRRYAALSALKSELESQKNALERMRKIPSATEIATSKGRALKKVVGGNPGAQLEDAINILRQMPDLQAAAIGARPVVYNAEDAGTAPIRSARRPIEDITRGGGRGAPVRSALPPPPPTTQ